MKRSFSLCLDIKKELRLLNNIQAAVQTEDRDEGKFLPFVTKCMSSGELPAVYTTDQNSFDLDGSELFSCKTPHEIPCTDSSYKVYPSYVRPDLQDIATAKFSYLHFSKSVSTEMFSRTDYCMNSTYLKQLPVEDETKLECLWYDTDTANDTFFRKYENEIPSDSICTSFEDRICNNSITSTITSYPIQSRSLTDIHTSLHTTSLSSNEPESGQTVDVNSLDVKYGQLLVESHTGTENMFQGEKKQSAQTVNESSNSNTSLQYSYTDMNPRVITELEHESEHQEPNDGHVDFTDSDDSFDNEDDSQSTDQNNKVLSFCKNNVESYSLQSTKDIAKCVSDTENHNLMTLEETVNTHISNKNSDREKPNENLNFLKEKGKTYLECHPENNYLEDMKEYYDFEDMKENTNSKTDIEHRNSGTKIVKSQNSHESAKLAEDNASLQDGINAIRYENVGGNSVPENVEANADVLNVQEKTNLQNVEEGSHLQKVEVDVFSKSVKRYASLYINKDADCHLHKESGGYSTNLNQLKGPNKDKAVLISTVLNEGQAASRRDNLSECKACAEKCVKMDGKSYIQEKIQKDISLIGLNNERSLHKDAQVTILNRKKEDVKLNVNEVLEEMSTAAETIGRNQSVKLDGAKEPSVGITSGDEESSSESLGMESKRYNQENVLQGNRSLVKLNIENTTKRIDEQTASFEMEGKALQLDKSSEKKLSAASEIIEQYLTSTGEHIKIQKGSSINLLGVMTASVSSTVSVDKVLKGKKSEKDIVCFTEENFKEVSFAKWVDEKNALSGVRSDFSHSKACDLREHEIETRKEDFNEEQKPESFAVDVKVGDGRAQAQPAVKQIISHTKLDITTHRVAVAPYLCIFKQTTDTVGYIEHCLSSNFKTDGKENGQGFKMIEHGLARGLDRQKGDLRENEINMDGLPVKQRVKMRKEYQTKPNSTSNIKMKQASRRCDLKASYLNFGSRERVDTDEHVQKKHTYESEIIKSINLISYQTKEESVSGLPDAVEQKTKDPCKAQRTELLPCDNTDCRCKTGESKCLRHQQKDSLGKIWKVSRYFQSYDFLFQFLQCPQRNDNLDKDEKVESALRKRRGKQSQLIQKKQCSSFNKSSKRDFKMQQDLRKPLKLGERSGKISHGSTRQPKGKRCLTRSENCRRVSKLRVKIGSNFENSINNILKQNSRPEIDRDVWQTLDESTDSGLGTVECSRSYVNLETDKTEHAFYNSEVKLSFKKLRKLQGKLCKTERKIKEELSADYINAILNPLTFRPELSSVVVYPGLKLYFERFQEVQRRQEESLSYEWLRLESLRNYNGVGSIIHLARGGFYHDPLDGALSTRCYACNVLYHNWEYSDNVTEVHRRLSPNCPHLRGNASVSENISIDNGPPNRAESSVTAEIPEGTAGSPSVTTVNSITDSLRRTQIRDMVSH